MVPSIGKLICNNKDVIQQRDEDTATMMEMIMQKRNETILESNKKKEDINAQSSNHEDEILEIAEAIRELAMKLQTRRERLNATEMNPQLNASLTRTLNQVQKTIVPTPRYKNKKTNTIVQQTLLDAYSRLQSSQDEEWLIDIVTPKAGNLSLLDQTTPLHSNLSRTQYHKTGKNGIVPPNRLYPNPYPLTSKRPATKIKIVQNERPNLIDDSLANLRDELTRAKTMEYHNENHSVTKKKHPFSTRNLRSVSRPRDEVPYSFEHVPQKQHEVPMIVDGTNKKTREKFRSLSTGRVAQSGIQIINRILRRDNQDEAVCVKTLTATSSDSTHEPIPSSSYSGKIPTSTRFDSKLDITISHHSSSGSSLRKNGNIHGDPDRCSDHPTSTRDRSVGRRRMSTRAMTPRKSTTETSTKRQPKLIDASVSNDVSMTSGYLASTSAQCPIKYRSSKISSEKGFEIFMPDDGSTTPITTNTKPNNRSNIGTISDIENRSTSSSSFDRAATSQRLRNHQKSIKDKIRKDLNVVTDHHHPDDEMFETDSDKVLTTTTTTTTTTAATTSKSQRSDFDSTRAIFIRDDKIMNGEKSKSYGSSSSSISSSTTSGRNTTGTTSAVVRKGTPSRTRRTIIRE